MQHRFGCEANYEPLVYAYQPLAWWTLTPRIFLHLLNAVVEIPAEGAPAANTS